MTTRWERFTQTRCSIVQHQLRSTKERAGATTSSTEQRTLGPIHIKQVIEAEELNGSYSNHEKVLGLSRTTKLLRPLYKNRIRSST